MSKKTTSRIVTPIVAIVVFASFLAWFIDTFTKYCVPKLALLWLVFVFVLVAVVSYFVAYKIKKGRVK